MATALWETIQTKLNELGIPIEHRGRHIFILCPFHSEDVPSCAVNPDMGVFHCFGCHARGTLTKLARHLGVAVSDNDKLSLLIKSWENAGQAKDLIFRYRAIKPEVSELYRVGYIENGKPEVLIPHPAPDDFNAYIAWDLKSYHFSSGLNKLVPFGYSLAHSDKVFVVEGVFDAMSLTQIGKPAVATLGNNTILGIAEMFPTFILAPDNDGTGKRLLMEWANELTEINKLALAWVCLWKHKDANDALKDGTLETEAQRVYWLPSYLIARAAVEAKGDIERAKQLAEPYLRVLTEKQREQAVNEAMTWLKPRYPTLDLTPLLELDEPAWVKVLRLTAHDPDMLRFLLNQPDFSLTLLPTKLRTIFLTALSGNIINFKSPFAQNAVKWAWRKAKEQAMRELKRKLNL